MQFHSHPGDASVQGENSARGPCACAAKLGPLHIDPFSFDDMTEIFYGSACCVLVVVFSRRSCYHKSFHFAVGGSFFLCLDILHCSESVVPQVALTSCSAQHPLCRRWHCLPMLSSLEGTNDDWLNQCWIGGCDILGPFCRFFCCCREVKSPDLLQFDRLCQSLVAASGIDILHCSASVVPQVALSSDVMFAFLGTDDDRWLQCWISGCNLLGPSCHSCCPCRGVKSPDLLLFDRLDGIWYTRDPLLNASLFQVSTLVNPCFLSAPSARLNINMRGTSGFDTFERHDLVSILIDHNFLSYQLHCGVYSVNPFWSLFPVLPASLWCI